MNTQSGFHFFPRAWAYEDGKDLQARTVSESASESWASVAASVLALVMAVARLLDADAIPRAPRIVPSHPVMEVVSALVCVSIVSRLSNTVVTSRCPKGIAETAVTRTKAEYRLSILANGRDKAI